MGKLVALLALVIALIVLGVIGYTWWQDRGATGQLAGATRAAGEAALGAGQTRADSAAERIVYVAAGRDRATETLAETHHAQILAAPGADAPLDPRLLDATRRGLCEYAAYRDDPQCAGLHPPDPAQLPQTGETGDADRR